MAARKIVPVSPEPTKVRRIQGTFAWLDHRLLREGHLERMTPVDVAVYVFLVLATNREGCSYYRKDQACKKLGIDWDQFACNRAAGWEKGRVERTIQYIRSNFLLGRTFRSLDELNASAREWRDEKANRRVHKTTGKRPIDLFTDDRARLLALPEVTYDTCILGSARITPDCRATFENNTYSAPPKYVGQNLTLRASPTEVCLYDGPSLIARHHRSYETHQDILDADHAKAVLDRKRRASGQTLQRLFLALAPEAKESFSGLVKSELSVERHLQRILDLVATYGKAEVMGAILRALKFGAFGSNSRGSHGRDAPSRSQAVNRDILVSWSERAFSSWTMTPSSSTS
jgi:hypothetical protein